MRLPSPEGLTVSRSVFAALILAGAAYAQGEDPWLPATRVELYALEDRGGLDDETVAAILSGTDDGLCDALLDVLLYERPDFPVAMCSALAPIGRARLIEALADRPRAATAPWLRLHLEQGSLTPPLRLLAIAALPPDEITTAFAREAVVASTGEWMSAAHQATARFTEKTADSMVATVHSELMKGGDPSALLVCLHNVSVAGEKHVLALARVLPDDVVEQLCHWLSGRQSEGLAQHITEALDRDEALSRPLLRRSGPFLTTPERVARVQAVLEHGEPEQQVLAYYALIEAGAVSDALIDFGLAADDEVGEKWSPRAQRARGLSRLPLSRLPERALWAMVDDPDRHIRQAGLRALSREAFDPALEPELIRRARLADAVGYSALRALVLYGSDEAYRQAWRDAESFGRVQAIEWMVERPRAFTAELLRETLAEVEAGEPVDVALRFALHLGLVTLGERSSVETLLEELPELSFRQVQKCAGPLGGALDPRDLGRVVTLATSEELDCDTRETVTTWLAQRTDLDGTGVMAALHQGDECEEVRLAALNGLMKREDTARRFHEALRQAMGRPLSSDERDLAYEILAGAPTPLREIDLDTIARLLFVAPVSARDPELLDELPMSGEYPLQTAAIDVLRRQKSFDSQPIEAVVEAMLADPAAVPPTIHRLIHVVTESAKFRATWSGLAPFAARLALASPGIEEPFAGIAWLAVADHAEDEGRFGDAADAYELAARSLLRTELPRMLERALIGNTSAPDGELPKARLAARESLNRARALASEGDAVGARAALEVAAKLGEGDTATLSDVEELSRRIDR